MGITKDDDHYNMTCCREVPRTWTIRHEQRNTNVKLLCGPMRHDATVWTWTLCCCRCQLAPMAWRSCGPHRSAVRELGDAV